MLTYTVTSRDLAEEDIYAIEPVESLRKFLKPHESLSIVKTPCEGCIPEMTRVMGKNRNGDPVRIYLGNSSEDNQGYIKCRLDKSLLSPYLYISWKQRGFHTFRLFERRKMIAEFPDFESALAAYFPEGFIPEKSYRRNHSVFELMCRSFCRRQELKKIVTLLARRCEQMRDMESERTGKFIDSPRGMLDERRVLG